MVCNTSKHVTFQLPSPHNAEEETEDSMDYSNEERRGLLLTTTATASNHMNHNTRSEGNEEGGRGCLDVMTHATYALGNACYRVTLGPVFFVASRAYQWTAGLLSSSNSEPEEAPPTLSIGPDGKPIFHPGQSYEEIPYDGTPITKQQQQHVFYTDPPSRSSDYHPQPTNVSRNLLDPSNTVVPVVVIPSSPPLRTIAELESRLLLLRDALPLTVNVTREPSLATTEEQEEHEEHNTTRVPVVLTFAGPFKYNSTLAVRSGEGNNSTTPAEAFHIVESLLLDDAQSLLQIQSVCMNDLHWDTSAALFDEAAVDIPDALYEPFEDVKRRWMGLFHNIVAASLPTTTTTVGSSSNSNNFQPMVVAFQRCSFTPSDLLDGLLPPAVCRFATQLRFVATPLTDVHIGALLRRVRQVHQQEGECFSKLRVLQLSGTITADALNMVLRYFDDEVESSVLSEIVVPAGVVQVVMRHPLTMRLPSLLVNGKAAGNSTRRW